MNRKSELRRSGFKPRTEPMKTKTPIGKRRDGRSPARAKIRPRNPQRAAKKFARNFHSGEFCEFTSMQPCQTCGQVPIQWGPQYGDKWGSEVSHVHARGMGGCGGDWTQTVAQCPPCARAYEAAKQAWPKLNGHDMDALALEHHARWLAHVENDEWGEAA